MGLENNNFDNWSNTTLGVVMAKKGYIRGPFGSALKRGEMLNEGVPVYEQANAIYNHRKFRYFIGDEKHATLLRFTVKPNDILISCSGTFGRTTIIEDGDPLGIISQALLILRSDPNKINVKYLNYYLNSREGKIKLSGMSHGSVQVNIAKRADVESIELYLPPLSEQKAIANVLTSFDDKIELLQAQNKTLETMAQTIFKEWFGKYQIGDELLEGWKFSPFYSIAKYINGAAFKSQDFSKEKIGLPIVKIAELKNGITDSTAFSKKVVDSKYQIDNGDILFSWSGSPETSIDIFLWTSGKALLNQHTFNVKVEEISERAWVYFLLKYNKALFIHLAKMKQTTGLGHVTISDLKGNLFLLPPKNVIKQFNKVFNGFLDKIEINQNQIQSLTKTRDTLLPKLMSGQVRVNNINQTTDA